MSTDEAIQLPDRLFTFLHGGTPALLLTVDADGFARTAYTWAAAPDTGRVRFAADRGSTTLGNIERDGKAALQIAGASNILFLVKGGVRVIREQVAALPFPVSLAEMTVTEAKDQAWPGVTVTPLTYEWPEDQREKMNAMEAAVYEELREWEAQG